VSTSDSGAEASYFSLIYNFPYVEIKFIKFVKIITNVQNLTKHSTEQEGFLWRIGV